MRKTLLLSLALLGTATLLPASAPKPSSPSELSGETVVRSIGEKRVAVLLDSNGDHTVDKGFLLTMDVPLHKGYTAYFEKARIEFTDGYVRVVSDQNLVDLQVAGYPDPPAAPKDAKVVTLIGSALIQSSGDSGCDMDRAHNRDAEACFAYGKD